MKKIFKKIFLFFIICTFGLILKNVVYAANIQTSTGKNEIKIGESITLNFTKGNSNTEGYVTTNTPKKWSTSSKGVIEFTSSVNDCGSVTIRGLNAGKAKVTLSYESATSKGVTSGGKPNYVSVPVTIEETIEITVLNASQVLENLENAWKSIPSADANVNEIRDFIQSAANYHKEHPDVEDKFYEVNLDTLKSWEKTIEALGMDQITNYSVEYYKICARIRAINWESKHGNRSG